MPALIESPIKPAVWYGLTEDDTYECDGMTMHAAVERSDSDEVAIHAMIKPYQAAQASLYLNRTEALALAHLLIAKSLQEETD